MHLCALCQSDLDLIDFGILHCIFHTSQYAVEILKSYLAKGLQNVEFRVWTVPAWELYNHVTKMCVRWSEDKQPCL